MDIYECALIFIKRLFLCMSVDIVCRRHKEGAVPLLCEWVLAIISTRLVYGCVCSRVRFSIMNICVNFLRFRELNILCNLHHSYMGIMAAQPVIQCECWVLFLPGGGGGVQSSDA